MCGNAGILRFERFAEAFRELQIHRRIKSDLALFFRRRDQGRRNRFRRRRGGDTHGESAEAKCSRTFEHIAFCKLFDHGVLLNSNCSWPVSYSITSSARASNVGDMVSPSALAVLTLIASSNFTGDCTGRLAVRAPLRMRST